MGTGHRIPIRQDGGLEPTPNAEFYMAMPYARGMPQNTIPPDGLVTAQNCHTNIAGRKIKRKGAGYFPVDNWPAGSDPAMSAFFEDEDGNEYLVLINRDNGQLYYKKNIDDFVRVTENVWDSSLTTFLSWAVFDNKLYITDGIHALKVFDGETVEDVGINVPVSGPDIAYGSNGYMDGLDISYIDSNALFSGIGNGIWEYKIVFTSDEGAGNPSQAGQGFTPALTGSSDTKVYRNSISHQWYDRRYVTGINLTIPASTDANVTGREIYRRYKDKADFPFSPWEKIADIPGKTATTFKDVHTSKGTEIQIDNDKPPLAKYIESTRGHLHLGHITDDNVLEQPIVTTVYPNFEWEFDARLLCKIVNTSSKIYTDVLVPVEITRVEGNTGIYLPDITGLASWHRGFVPLDSDGVTPLPQTVQTQTALLADITTAIRFPEIIPGENYFYIAYRYNHTDVQWYNTDANVPCHWPGVKSTHLFYFDFNDQLEDHSSTYARNKVEQWNDDDYRNDFTMNNGARIGAHGTNGPRFYNLNQASGPALSVDYDHVIELQAAIDSAEARRPIKGNEQANVIGSDIWYKNNGNAQTSNEHFALDVIAHQVDQWIAITHNPATGTTGVRLRHPTYSSGGLIFRYFTNKDITNGNWWNIRYQVDFENNFISIYIREETATSGSYQLAGSSNDLILFDIEDANAVHTVGKWSPLSAAYESLIGYYKTSIGDNYIYLLEEADAVSRRIMPSEAYILDADSDNDVDIYEETHPKKNRMRWCKGGKPNSFPPDYYDDLQGLSSQITGMQKYRNNLKVTTGNRIANLSLAGDERSWQVADSLRDDYAGLGVSAPRSIFEHSSGMGGLSSNRLFIVGDDGLQYIDGLREALRDKTRSELEGIHCAYLPEVGQLYVGIGTEPETPTDDAENIHTDVWDLNGAGLTDAESGVRVCQKAFAIRKLGGIYNLGLVYNAVPAVSDTEFFRKIFRRAASYSWIEDADMTDDINISEAVPKSISMSICFNTGRTSLYALAYFYPTAVTAKLYLAKYNVEEAGELSFDSSTLIETIATGTPSPCELDIDENDNIFIIYHSLSGTDDIRKLVKIDVAGAQTSITWDQIQSTGIYNYVMVAGDYIYAIEYSATYGTSPVYYCYIKLYDSDLTLIDSRRYDFGREPAMVVDSNDNIQVCAIADEGYVRRYKVYVEDSEIQLIIEDEDIVALEVGDKQALNVRNIDGEDVFMLLYEPDNAGTMYYKVYRDGEWGYAVEVSTHEDVHTLNLNRKLLPIEITEDYMIAGYRDNGITQRAFELEAISLAGEPGFEEEPYIDPIDLEYEECYMLELDRFISDGRERWHTNTWEPTMFLIVPDKSRWKLYFGMKSGPHPLALCFKNNVGGGIYKDFGADYDMILQTIDYSYFEAALKRFSIIANRDTTRAVELAMNVIADGVELNTIYVDSKLDIGAPLVRANRFAFKLIDSINQPLEVDLIDHIIYPKKRRY